MPQRKTCQLSQLHGETLGKFSHRAGLLYSRTFEAAKRQHAPRELQVSRSDARYCKGSLRGETSCGYCEVINRIGTGEVPYTEGVKSVAVLLQPATFNTVTLTLPLPSMSLMNTCKNPTIVTGVWLALIGN